MRSRRRPVRVLELLAQRPGLTNAELARGVFVTRQATHQLLAGLRSAGLIEIQGAGRHQRVVITEHGPGRPGRCWPGGAGRTAHALPLSGERQAELFRSLAACTEALSHPAEEPVGRIESPLSLHLLKVVVD